MFGRDSEKHKAAEAEGRAFEPAPPVTDSDSDNGAYDPNSGVKRGLKNRHLSMM